MENAVEEKEREAASEKPQDVERRASQLRKEVEREAEIKNLVKTKGLTEDQAKKEIKKSPAERQADRERAVVAGSIGKPQPKILPEAEDHGEKIGRYLLLATRIPIEVLGVKKQTYGAYEFRIKSKRTGTIRKGSINHHEFLYQERRDPKYLGSWFASIVDSAFRHEEGGRSR